MQSLILLTRLCSSWLTMFWSKSFWSQRYPNPCLNKVNLILSFHSSLFWKVNFKILQASPYCILCQFFIQFLIASMWSGNLPNSILEATFDIYFFTPNKYLHKVVFSFSEGLLSEDANSKHPQKSLAYNRTGLTKLSNNLMVRFGFS